MPAPVTFTDQFFTIDPFAPPPFGTPLNFSLFDLIDQNDDGDIDQFNGDSVNGQDVTGSFPGDTVTVNVPGVGNITYTGTGRRNPGFHANRWAGVAEWHIRQLDICKHTGATEYRYRSGAAVFCGWHADFDG